MCMTQYINVQGRRTLSPAAGRKTRRKIYFLPLVAFGQEGRG